jgi:hypothetical protein
MRSMQHNRHAYLAPVLAMATKHIDYPIEPMDLANMRQNGVRSLDIMCDQCRHETIMMAKADDMDNRSSRGKKVPRQEPTGASEPAGRPGTFANTRGARRAEETAAAGAV